MADIRISELPQAGSITGAELVPIVQNGQTVQTTTGAIAASPTQTQTFLTVTQESTLPNSRYFGVGLGLGYSDAGIQGLYQIYLDGTSASLENASTGIIVKSGVDTITPRQIAVSGNGLSIADGTGVSGNPTISLSGLPSSLASLSGNGMLAINSGSAIVARTLTGTTNQIDIANATGTANPTFSIADNPVLGGSEGLVVPVGTTGERPLGTNGLIRYNTSLSRFEVYANDAWQTLGAGDGTVTQVNGTANEIDVINGTTTPTVGIADNPIIPGTGAMTVPVGTDAQKPAGNNGQMRYNSDTQQFEGYVNGSWTPFASGSGVTSITAGTGLTGGTITSIGTIAIDTSVVVTLTGSQVLTNKTISGSSNTLSNIGNSALTNSSITINGTSVSLGGSATITASNPNALTIGTGLSGTSYDGSSAVTIALANTTVTANTYGSASAVPVFAVNAQGQITSVTNTNISIASSAITDKGLANGVASLDGSGTVPTSQLPAAVLGAVNYQGTWNASTNTPTLASGVGTKGYYYVVSTAGTTDLDGITSWNVGDWAIYNGTAWQKIDNTDAVTSVNGLTGAVVLTTTNIAEGTNEYFTTAKARLSLSAGTGISYDNVTGVITNTNTSSGDVVGPASATDNAIARFDTTTGKLIQNSAVTIDDAGNIISPDSVQFSGTAPVTQPIGTLWFDSSTDTLNLQQNAITQQIGEEIYVYGKASNTISGQTLLQAVVKTGVVGASGVIQFGVAGSGVTDGGSFIGVATEDIATNSFGRITNFGVVHGINTTGSTYGETWADGDDIWYNPTTGGLTKTKPSAPNIKVQIGTIIHAGSGGSGSFQVLLNTGSSLGGTDDNVQFSTLNTDNLLQYNGTYWTNVAPSTVTVGTATNATNVATTSDSTNATRYLTFLSATTGNNGVLVDSDLTYNPSTNTMSVGTLVATTGISGGTF